jgi:hypothetical protein
MSLADLESFTSDLAPTYEMLNSWKLMKEILQTKVVNSPNRSKTYEPCRVNHPCHIFIFYSLSYALHSILGVDYDFKQEELSQELWGSTFMKPQGD